MEPTGYKGIFKVHVENSPLAKMPIRDITPKAVRLFLESLPRELSHSTHMRIKAFLSGVFKWAIGDDAYSGSNPVDNQIVGGWNKEEAGFLEGLPKAERVRREKARASNEHAYSLDEVETMLEKLPDPAKTVCVVAAYTGPTRSELKGLQWRDYKPEEGMLYVQRKVWRNHTGATKTEARESGVPLLPQVIEALNEYRNAFPEKEGCDWIFRGEKSCRPLDLDNLSRREIPQYVDGAWFGWHAFRRGLGTRLYELPDIKDKIVQDILRHANVATTRDHYIKPDKSKSVEAMKKFGKAVEESKARRGAVVQSAQG